MIRRRSLLVASLAAGTIASSWSAGSARAADAQPLEQAMGSADAPVTMIEYASLTCPHCAAFHKETLPALKEKYIDTGKVRLIFRDFPLDRLALDAAKLAHCAGPDRYFTFLGAFFQNQERWATAEDPRAALRQLALLGGLSGEKADACLNDRALEDGILQSRLDAEKQHQIESTPSFLINGKLYAGNQGIDKFSAIIDALL